jgi:antitoxin component YwqK of YwqJK toxin-antitoxin module
MTKKTNQYDSQGNRHGVWEHYYANGSLWWRAHFLNGKHHGTREWYHSDGRPQGKGYYLRIK